MIAVTGGAGFIGSAIIRRLNVLGRNDILVVDELGNSEKWKNLVPLSFDDFINKHEFISMIGSGTDFNLDAVIHMGANSSTTEKDADHLLKNNYEYTKILADYSLNKNIRFIYASSAATYGDGSLGFKDDEEFSSQLHPLNMYGYSKNLFDIRAHNKKLFRHIAGLKYFNVYGPNEYHKGDMRSVVHKAFEQISFNGEVNLFKSKNSAYKDGEQKRDFIYVKDAVEMTLFFLENRNVNGLFNIGSGIARSWNDLAAALFNALNKPVKINYIDMPPHLAEKYQYFTEADITKINEAGYNQQLFSLEEGVTDYAKYLLNRKYLGLE
jgi:ADP-L-glycero-D-manno-heptose 6-epimerase